ncbi:hypothetical protein EJ08DRAFT_659142 [Tothia fuscella]|uniref:Uncharacterized protein n=1 Tax=Tothia fuscella TaxID=1048955 RepID=A0A9P4U0Z9_9PEZI|nr:hypothetical protein EJ08DRAFT_659142 [Tothia fuscella]
MYVDYSSPRQTHGAHGVISSRFPDDGVHIWHLLLPIRISPCLPDGSIMPWDISISFVLEELQTAGQKAEAYENDIDSGQVRLFNFEDCGGFAGFMQPHLFISSFSGLTSVLITGSTSQERRDVVLILLGDDSQETDGTGNFQDSAEHVTTDAFHANAMFEIQGCVQSIPPEVWTHIELILSLALSVARLSNMPKESRSNIG